MTTEVRRVSVQDGEVLFDDFGVIGTPGRTNGHIAYYYEPEAA